MSQISVPMPSHTVKSGESPATTSAKNYISDPDLNDLDLHASFYQEMKGRIPEAVIEEMVEFQKERYLQWYDQIGLLSKSEEGIQKLQLTGEYPVCSPVSILSGQLYGLPLRTMAQAMTARHFDLMNLTHPYRLEGVLQKEAEGYTPVKTKRIALFDRLLSDTELSTFEEFALKPKQPEPPQEGITIDEKTLSLHAKGLHSWTSRKMVTNLTNYSSMPTIVGAYSMATGAIGGAMSFAPTDSYWKTPESKIAMINRARELIANDPVVLQHKFSDYQLSNGMSVHDYILERSNKLLGATLKIDNIVEEARPLVEAGVTLFRVYDAGSTSGLYKAVKDLREAYGDKIVIVVGQLTGPDQAEELAEYADAFVVGIGDGEMCITSTRADISGDNIKTGYEIIREGFGVPLLFDGGVGNKMGVLLATGGAGNLSSRAAVGGTIEQPPFFWFKSPLGEYAKNYEGEAGPSTKINGGNVDYLGRPFNLEGVDGYVSFNAEEPTAAYRIYLRHQALAKMLRFQRLRSVDELQRMIEPDIYRMPESVRKAAGSHHN